jgi:hypothetical protein
MAAVKLALDSLKKEGKAMVYTLANGDPKPLIVLKGLSDGVWMETGGDGLMENTVVITGIKGTDKVQSTKSLFQGPSSGRGANLRRMQQ